MLAESTNFAGWHGYSAKRGDLKQYVFRGETVSKILVNDEIWNLLHHTSKRSQQSMF